MDSHLITYKKLQEQSTISLIKCVQTIFGINKYEIINCKQDKPRNVYKELFKRFITPFYLPLLILIAAINLIISKENINYLKFRFSIFILGTFVIIISESSIGFIGNIFFKNIFFILIPIISILIIYLILIYKLKFHKSKI